MTYFAGLDVSLEETSICVVDEAGRIVKELFAPRASRKRLSWLCWKRVWRWSALAWKPAR